MRDFYERDRYTLEQARESFLQYKGPCIMHPIYNEDDNTYSLMSHIVCEHCDYCDDQNKYELGDFPSIIPLAKQDPYELQEIKWWYIMEFRYAFPGIIFGDDNIETKPWSRKIC